MWVLPLALFLLIHSSATTRAVLTRHHSHTLHTRLRRTEPKTWFYAPAPIVTQADRVQTPPPLEDPALEHQMMVSSFASKRGEDLGTVNPMLHVSVPLVPGDPNSIYAKPTINGFYKPPANPNGPGTMLKDHEVQHDPLNGLAPLPRENIPYKDAAKQFPYAGAAGGDNSHLISYGSSTSPFGVDPNSFANFLQLRSRSRRGGRAALPGFSPTMKRTSSSTPTAGKDQADGGQNLEMVRSASIVRNHDSHLWQKLGNEPDVYAANAVAGVEMLAPSVIEYTRQVQNAQYVVHESEEEPGDDQRRKPQTGAKQPPKGMHFPILVPRGDIDHEPEEARRQHLLAAPQKSAPFT